jgi:hypothetical protein
LVRGDRPGLKECREILVSRVLEVDEASRVRRDPKAHEAPLATQGRLVRQAPKERSVLLA